VQNTKEILTNAYEIELPPDLGISPIFNVAELYKYESETADNAAQDQETPDIDWVK